MSRRVSRPVILLAAAAAMMIVAGCNPLLGDPTAIGGGLELTTARLTGSQPVWIELAVSGASDTTVFAFALVAGDDLRGPTDRLCALPSGPVPCDVTATDVRMPDQRVVPGVDASTYVRLMTIWPDEKISVVLVCVNAAGAVGCPDSTRTALGAVTDAGVRTGDLLPT